MITLRELNPQGHQLTPEQQANLNALHTKMSAVRAAYGCPMIVTSGVRSWDEHCRIYLKNGVLEEVCPDGTVKVARGQRFPTKSSHLSGGACDIWDRDGRLWAWCMDNLALLEKLDLYLEDRTATPTWVHFQIFPPRSGHRVFLP